MTDNKNKKPGLLRYKLAALIGTIIMAIGAFMACLCVTPAYITVGNVLLIVSIVRDGNGEYVEIITIADVKSFVQRCLAGPLCNGRQALFRFGIG